MLRSRSSLVALLAALVAGCGGNVVVPGAGTTAGGGGAGGGATTTTSTITTTSSTTSTTATTTTPGTGGGVPGECAAPADGPGPFAVKLELKYPNPDGTPVYLRRDCHVRFDVFACADGYSEPLALHEDCTLDCADPGGSCIDCGACPNEAVGVVEDAPTVVEWSGHTFTFAEYADGCSCHTAQVAPAARYRVSVPVFPTAQAAQEGTGGWEAVADFVLPAPNGVVEVFLWPPQK